MGQRGGGRALPERGPALLVESVAASRRCPRSMRVGVRPEALLQRTPLQEPPHETRTPVLAPHRSPGVAELSLRSGTCPRRVPLKLFKSASAKLAIRLLPQSQPRHVCGSGGAARPRLDNDLLIPAAPPSPAEKLPALQGSNTSASH